MEDKQSLKLVLRWRKYEGAFWKALWCLFGEGSNIRWWWEIVGYHGNIVVKSVRTYATEADAITGALGVGKFLIKAQVYDVRKVN